MYNDDLWQKGFQQGHIKFIKNDSEDFYILAPAFPFISGNTSKWVLILKKLIFQ